jgi:hypothetical protein
MRAPSNFGVKRLLFNEAVQAQFCDGGAVDKVIGGYYNGNINNYDFPLWLVSPFITISDRSGL